MPMSDMRALIDLITETYRIDPLTEAPMLGIDAYGNDLDQEGSFAAFDRGFIKKSILKGTYVEKLKGLPFDLFVYILNDDFADSIAHEYPEGEIDWSDNIITGINLASYSIPDQSPLYQLRDVIAQRKAANPKAVHFVLGDNYSQDNQMPVTPWILVHRFCHAFLISSGIRIKEQLPSRGGPTNIDIDSYGMSRSFRNGTIEEVERATELATEYLLTGRIRIDYSRLSDDMLGLGFADDDVKKIIEEAKLAMVNFQKSVSRQISHAAGRTFYI